MGIRPIRIINQGPPFLADPLNKVRSPLLPVEAIPWGQRS